FYFRVAQSAYDAISCTRPNWDGLRKACGPGAAYGTMHSWMLFHGTGRILRSESDLRLLLGVISLQSRVCLGSHPNVQSKVTLSMTLLRTTSSFWLSRATKR